MATKISGTVEDENGNAISGATVYVINQSTNSVAAVTTTDSLGDYEVTGLDDTVTYHVGAQWDDGSTKYAGESLPFVEPFTESGAIDDFEDGDIDEYSGELVSFNTQNGTVYEGTEALEMGNDDGNIHRITSSSGLPRYPGKGDVFSFRIRFDGEVSLGAMDFGVQSDTSKYYRAVVAPDNGEIRLVKWDPGGGTILDSTSASIAIDEWHEATIDWGDADAGESITLTVLDSSGTQLGQVSAQDGTYTDGGIGWNGKTYPYTSDSVYFDICDLTQAAGDDGTEPSTSAFAHYTMEDSGSSSILNDQSGGGHDGSISGATYTTNSAGGTYALDFDDGDRVDFGDDSAFEGKTEMSISAWIYRRSNSRDPIMSEGRYSGGYHLSWIFDIQGDEELAFAYYEDDGTKTGRGTVSSGTTVPTGQYVHCGATYKGGQFVRIYIDGQRVNEGTSDISNDLPSNNYEAWLGIRKNDDFGDKTTDGIIDDVRLYNSVLTDENMRWLSNNPA